DEELGQNVKHALRLPWVCTADCVVSSGFRCCSGSTTSSAVGLTKPLTGQWGTIQCIRLPSSRGSEKQMPRQNPTSPGVCPKGPGDVSETRDDRSNKSKHYIGGYHGREAPSSLPEALRDVDDVSMSGLRRTHHTSPAASSGA
ncbi:hypothetical protein IAQ61_006094, partial [Plenodomus lingam]|uniref:uncharacterized protein n=1 Tax=Leptosphaeria maculans TaxID=5022 RepID=UPI003326500E